MMDNCITSVPPVPPFFAGGNSGGNSGKFLILKENSGVFPLFPPKSTRVRERNADHVCVMPFSSCVREKKGEQGEHLCKGMKLKAKHCSPQVFPPLFFGGNRGNSRFFPCVDGLEARA